MGATARSHRRVDRALRRMVLLSRDRRTRCDPGRSTDDKSPARGPRGPHLKFFFYCRLAADTGDVSAMLYLGRLLEDRRELAQAEQWYGGAADAGSTAAMYNMGQLLAQQRGDWAAAER